METPNQKKDKKELPGCTSDMAILVLWIIFVIILGSHFWLTWVPDWWGFELQSKKKVMGFWMLVTDIFLVFLPILILFLISLRKNNSK